MASQIKIKRSSVAGKVPTTSDIATGELAINTKDKKIYSSNGTVVFDFIAPYLQVANAEATYVLKNSAVFTGALTANGVSGVPGYYLRSSGSGIYWSPGGASWASLSGTNTALRTLISDRMQVANTKAYLANTNAYIATKVDTTTFNYALANTNAYIASVVSGGGGVPWSALTSTNTALRTLISDRLQVANAAATYLTKSNPSFTGTISAAAGGRIDWDSSGSYIGTPTTTTRSVGTKLTLYPSLSGVNVDYAIGISGGVLWNSLPAYDAGMYFSWYGGTTEVASLSGTGKLTVASISANGSTGIAGYYLRSSGTGIYWSPVATNADRATWNALTGTNTAIRLLINDRYQVANVNTLLNAKATWTALTGTNTAIRALVSDIYQIANVNTNFLKKSGTVPQTVVPNVSFSANVAIQGKLTVYGGVTTYTANNLVLGDNMIYLNSGNIVTNPDLGIAGNYNDGTYHHAGFFRDASDAGTWKVFENYSPEPDANTFINTAHASFKLAPFSARDARFTGVLSVTANTSVGNTTVGGFLKLNGTDIRATFAQNTYVKTTLANTNLRVNLINTNLTGTNTALRLLISDRYQVANVNTLLNAKATWAGLTGTNTAIRTLVSDRYQVANVNTLLAAKATWAGLIATNTAIRALDAQKLQVANATTLLLAKASWTGLTTTNTALRTLISDRLQVANASSTYLTKTNPVITGTLTANGVVGTAGYYLRTSGTGIYWSPVAAGGGGSSSNGFSAVAVGANVAVAGSTTARLTLVAGSGMTISANPATDTITFTASGGGGGSFTGGTISGATTVTDATASTSNLTGAFKVTGGVGVTGNIYTAGRVGYASNTTSGTSAAYTYYNSAAGSLDTVFG